MEDDNAREMEVEAFFHDHERWSLTHETFQILTNLFLILSFNFLNLNSTILIFIYCPTFFSA